ncbi:MAG TPA: hypothetical protein VLZ54_13655 [Arenibacter sp.]|nr:hypothetical protein [Arenibacter sp.]
MANINTTDVAGFLRLAAEIGIKPEVELYPLEEANMALIEFKEKRIRGASLVYKLKLNSDPYPI